MTKALRYLACLGASLALLAAPAAHAQDLPSLSPLSSKKKAPKAQPPPPPPPPPAAAPAAEPLPSLSLPSLSHKKPESTAERMVMRGPVAPVKPGQSVSLFLRLFDGMSQPATGKVALKADIGVVTEPVENAPGQFTATYQAPEDAPPGGSTAIKAELKNGAKPVSAQVTITFTGTPVRSVAAVAEPETSQRLPTRIIFAGPIKTRSGKAARLNFRLEDDKGEPVDFKGVVLRSDSGLVTNVKRTDDGYTALFTPTEDSEGELSVVAEANGEALNGRGVVVVERSAARAGEGGGAGVDVSALAGGLSNLGKIASAQLELVLEKRIAGSWRLGALAGFAPEKANDLADSTGVTPASFSFSVVPLLLRAGWGQRTGPVDLHVVAMGGVALVSGSTSSFGGPASFSKTVPCFGAAAGAGLPVGPGDVLVELRMTSAPFQYRDDAHHFEIARGNLGGLSGAIGYRLEL